MGARWVISLSIYLAISLTAYIYIYLFIYIYIYTYIYIYMYIFDGACLTTVILAPGARKGGCELPAKSHFNLIAGIWGIGGIRG